jgi:hypothetical protein
MPADLDTLLPRSGGEPTAPLDTDAMWARGRRRRAVRNLSAATGGLAGIAALALVATSLVSGGSGGVVPEITPMAPPADTTTDDPDGTGTADGADEADEADEAATDPAPGDESTTPFALDADVSAAEEQRLAESAEQQRRSDESEDATVEPEGEEPSSSSSAPDTAPSAPEPAPSPSASRVADPCAVHEDGEMRAFIDVVAPVTDQRVSGSIDLVGCASVYEGTVRYRLSKGGSVLVDSFTTATAGGPGIGAFRESIALPATGRLTLEVFWDSPATGEGERDRTAVSFDAG